MSDQPDQNEIQIFSGEDGEISVQLNQKTVWLTQRQMGQLFGTTPENILMHLRNIFKDQELEETTTSKDFLVVQAEGKRQVRRELVDIVSGYTQTFLWLQGYDEGLLNEPSGYAWRGR